MISFKTSILASMILSDLVVVTTRDFLGVASCSVNTVVDTVSKLKLPVNGKSKRSYTDSGPLDV